MNFHEGGPSNFSFNAPLPPSDGEEQPSAMINNEFHLINQQQMVLSQLISATVVADYFQEGWAGQYVGRSGKPTIILEAVADYELWIWHAYFGLPGSNNNINVLSKSHLFANLANGVAPPANYVIQGKEYTMKYYLADGIYPKWATLVQIIHNPQGPKRQYFAVRQDSCIKDVERAFGTVLQSKWTIITGPTRFWSKLVLHDIMTTCIIMHNMIIEDEKDEHVSVIDYREAPTPYVERAHDEHVRFQEFFARHCQIKDNLAHYALRDALIDHLWEEYSNSEY
ncbi:uncharacterized protein [Henckelia pumila]|uniref:uncharacterized protein n=1 Tax=Henckelia pumila TaxID=405737 RepID=UPI003C6E7072